MNILIYGKVGSGKTFTATALKHYYERQRQHCDILEDDGSHNHLGVHFLAGPRVMAKFLKKTLHNETRHFIRFSSTIERGKGYYGFFAQFQFNLDGKFEQYGIWE